MAFIEKTDPIVLNIKLTSKGRELLSKGLLDFKYYAIGDSEIDYKFNAAVNSVDENYTAFNSSILRPVDKNPSILSFITRNITGDSYNDMSTIPTINYSVENQVNPIGFFSSGSSTFITDANHVKQPDAMVQVSGVSGGFNLILIKAPTYGTSGEEPAIGDILFIRWTYDQSTTGTSVNISYPTPNLFYKITAINSGTLGSGSVEISLDRELPDFSGMGISGDIYAGAMILYNQLTYSGATVTSWTPTDYLDQSVISFLENSQCPTVIFPFWNMTIVHTEEIAGVQAGNKKYTQFNSRVYGGFVSYIQNQAPIYKRLGIIHYSNSTPANVYGEGFLLTTSKLEIPTIMWHKSTGQTLGATFVPFGNPKILTGETTSLNLIYYDLVDNNDKSVVVGKVFNDLKIFVIEDQELLYAMSYKSNRSWTFPDYNAGTNTIINRSVSTTGGTTVTWTSPLNVTTTSTICALEYCHAHQDWTPFTGTISCGNICDAGYRVGVCTTCYLCSSTINICARDYVSGTNICQTGTGIPPLTSATVQLTDINHSTGYYFTGCIY